MHLNFLYYPISWLMRVWYKFFCIFFGDTSCLPWILSVIFLVLTIRAFLLPFTLKQMKNQRLMQKYAPELKAIGKQYKNDKQAKYLAEKKFRDEHGITMMGGCLPPLIQSALFISLYHVLREFNKMGASGYGFFSHTTVTPEQARHSVNYMFTQPEVERFLDARAFGVPLSTYITQPQEQFLAFVRVGEHINFSRINIACVLIPLMIISALATHFNSRASMKRQNFDDTLMPGAPKIMGFVTLWLFPIFTMFSGFVMPGSILLYFMTNNLSTFIQTHFGHIFLDKKHKIDSSKTTKILEDKLKPKPGAKPNRK